MEGTSWQEVQRRTLTGQRADINLLPFCNSMAQLSSRRPCRNISLTRAGYYCYRCAEEHAKEEKNVITRPWKTKSLNGVLSSDILLSDNRSRCNNGDRIKCRSSLNFFLGFGCRCPVNFVIRFRRGPSGAQDNQSVAMIPSRSRVSTNRRMENVKDTTNWISSRPIEKSPFGKSTDTSVNDT